MKKSLFILPITALAFAACSSEDVVTNIQQQSEANGNELTIMPVVQGATRATSVTTNTLAAFKVNINGLFQKGETDPTPWGSSEIQTVTKTNGKWAFDGDVHYWWSNKTDNAKFTAWAPTTIAAASGTYQVENTVADQEDVLVAYNEGTREDFEDGVPLNFQHVLSQIVFQAKNSSTSDISVKIAAVQLNNVANSGTLKAIDVKTESTFDWTTYTPWSSVGGSDDYANGTATSVSPTSTLMTLTASNSQLIAPLLLMPQTLTGTADALKAEEATALADVPYLSLLIQVQTTAKVGYQDKDGYFYKNSVDANGDNKIAFTTKRDGTSTGVDDNTNDSYTAAEYAALKAGTVPAYTDGSDGVTTRFQIQDDGWTASDVIFTDYQTLYPKVGYSTKNAYYANVGVALNQTWDPGKKYTYTLNFSKDGIGKSIADQPSDASTVGDNFPYGKDFVSGEDQKPGTDIVDNPVELFFTVTVDSWTDADAINEDM